MNLGYNKIIAARDIDRRDLFLSAAQRLGTTVQNTEKDFWVCWTLDALFNRLEQGGPRLLFKGGTSLSKSYSLISRFSEDIDVTVFRSDLGEDMSLEGLEGLSKKKQSRRLDDIKTACQRYINDKLRTELDEIAKKTMTEAGRNPTELRVVLDENEIDKQSLLIHYPSDVEKAGYVQPSIKIESGAKSALDPNEPTRIVPYLATDIADPESLAVAGVTTIKPERTFLDKILILHGMTYYFEATGTLRGNGRMSRHYYDVHRLTAGAVGQNACSNAGLIADCVRHAKMFFYRKNTGLEDAKRGSFRLLPSAAMLNPLRRDYEAMATMIFGDVPTFDAVLTSIAQAEDRLNAA
jgi:hypothetical protein